jgi:hypothetical protein
VNQVALILKDENGTKVQGDPAFYPTTIHVTITIVAKGSTYVPPPTGEVDAGSDAATVVPPTRDAGAPGVMGARGASSNGGASGAGGSVATGGTTTTPGSGGTAPPTPSTQGSSSPPPSSIICGCADRDDDAPGNRAFGSRRARAIRGYAASRRRRGLLDRSTARRPFYEPGSRLDRTRRLRRRLATTAPARDLGRLSPRPSLRLRPRSRRPWASRRLRRARSG